MSVERLKRFLAGYWREDNAQAQANAAAALPEHNPAMLAELLRTCPACGAKLPPEALDAEHDSATCIKCSLVFSPSQRVSVPTLKHLPALPADTVLIVTEDSLGVRIDIQKCGMKLRNGLIFALACLLFLGLTIVTLGIGLLFTFSRLQAMRNLWREEQYLTLDAAGLRLEKKRPGNSLEYAVAYPHVARVVLADLHREDPARMGEDPRDPLGRYHERGDSAVVITTPVIEHTKGFIHFGERLDREDMRWLVNAIKAAVLFKTGTRV